jgi:hypothetical protein
MQSSACSLLLIGFMLGLLLGPEGGGDMVLGSIFFRITRRYNPEYGTPHSHCCEMFKSNVLYETLIAGDSKRGEGGMD